MDRQQSGAGIAPRVSAISAETSARRRLKARPFLSGFVAVLLGGCSLISPHVHDDALFETTYSAPIMAPGSKSVANPNAAAVTFAGDLANAIDDANAQRVAYLDAAGEYSTVRNTAPLLATALGAAALFLTVTTGGISDTAAGLGLGSAGTIGLAAYYENRPRQMVYISGADAIGCSIVAQRPLLMLAEDYDAFVGDLAALENSLATLAALRAKYGAIDPWIVRMDGYLPDDVDDVLQKGQTTYSAGVALKTSINTAGLALREKVISIVTAVDREIVKTDPDPKGITNILASLSASGESIVPGLLAVPKQKAPKTEDEMQGLEGTHSQEQLDFIAAVDLVRQKSQLVALRVERAQTLGDITASLEACKPAEAQSTIRIFPDDPGVTDIVPGESRTYTVMGGVGLPRVGVAGNFPAGSVKSKMELGNGAVQVVVETTAAAKGSGQVIFADGSELAPKIVRFRMVEGVVAPEPDGGGDDGDGNDGDGNDGDGNDGGNAAGNNAGGSNDGGGGEVVANNGGANNAGGGGVVDNAIVGSISKEEAVKLIGPKTPIEHRIMSGEVSKIMSFRCSLGVANAPNMEPDTLFDAEFRGKLYDFQDANADAGTTIARSGLIDEKTFGMLSQLSPGNC